MAHGDNQEIRALIEIIEKQIAIINKLIDLLTKQQQPKAPVITKVSSSIK